MLETETDSEAEASDVVVKRRAILWDMAVGEQIRYEVATIRKCMVILGRLSSFFGEEDPETGKRLGELALIWPMLWSWLRTLGKVQRQRSTTRTIALSFSGPRVSAESPGQHGCSELSSTEPLEFPGYEMEPRLR